MAQEATIAIQVQPSSGSSLPRCPQSTCGDGTKMGPEPHTMCTLPVIHNMFPYTNLEKVCVALDALLALQQGGDKGTIYVCPHIYTHDCIPWLYSSSVKRMICSRMARRVKPQQTVDESSQSSVPEASEASGEFEHYSNPHRFQRCAPGHPSAQHKVRFSY
jgi:hypothetical protein